MLHAVAIFIIQENLKQTQNKKQMKEMRKIAKILIMRSKKSTSVLRRRRRRNIVYFAWFVDEKDKLHYSKYGSTKRKNLIICRLYSGEVNLEFDDPPLVAVAKRLEIMMYIPLMLLDINAILISPLGITNQLKLIEKTKIV